MGDVAAGLMADLRLGAFDHLLRTTARAAFLINREAAHHVRAGGTIVNLTGSRRESTSTRGGAYTAMAAAINALSCALALELQPRNVTVNAVALDIDPPCSPDSAADVIADLIRHPERRITGQVIPVQSSRTEG